MKKLIFLFSWVCIVFTTSCAQNNKTQMSEVETWKLGWRMIESSMLEKNDLANKQFDSLKHNSLSMDYKFLITGLEVWSKESRNADILELIKNQDQNMLEQICNKKFLSGLEPCKEYAVEKVLNKELQIEIIKMFINDQYVRTKLMTDILEKYNLKKEEVILDINGIYTDEKNRERLKEIIAQYGFPTRNFVGEDAMHGIFLIIQHSGMEKEWQKSQLANIEKAVKMGDMDVENYAYLYDRIKINSGEKQLYGSQFAKVDLNNKVAELALTEDLENLDSRRKGMGMMPIEMYRSFMLHQ